MKLKFAYIEIIKEIENRRKYIVLSLFSFPIVGLIMQPKSSNLITYLIVGLFLIDIIIILLYRALVKRYKIIGVIAIDKDFIQILDKKYPLNKLKKIIIFYKGFKGESFPYARFGVNQISSKDGAGNRLLLNINSEENVEINFLSTNKSDLVRLKQMLQHYYDNGIDVKLKRI